MADPATKAAATTTHVSPQVVGNAFVQHYYNILHHASELVYRFYRDISTIGRPEEDGSMSMTTTIDAINAKIMSLKYGNYKSEIVYVDVQESLNGGVNVLVTGSMVGKDNILQNFVLSFYLASFENDYFVLNDMFRFITNSNYHEEDYALSEDHVTLDEVPEIVPVAESIVFEQVGVSTDESDVDDFVFVENEEVSNESIAMETKQNVPTRNPEQNLNNAYTTTVAAKNDGYYSVYVKGIPDNTTPALLEKEFIKFGPIKPDGIEVKHNRLYTYAFIDFEVPDAVQKAVKASPITINGKEAIVGEILFTEFRDFKWKIYRS